MRSAALLFLAASALAAQSPCANTAAYSPYETLRAQRPGAARHPEPYKTWSSAPSSAAAPPPLAILPTGTAAAASSSASPYEAGGGLSPSGNVADLDGKTGNPPPPPVVARIHPPGMSTTGHTVNAPRHYRAVWMGAPTFRHGTTRPFALSPMPGPRRSSITCGFVMSGSDAAYTRSVTPDLAQFHRLTNVRYLNPRASRPT